MFRKHSGRRSANPIIALFRLILSLTMLVVLLAGTYSAYKHFSGLDPLKIDPQSLVVNVLGVRTPDQLKQVLSAIKLPAKITDQISTNLPGQSPAPDKTGPLFSFLMVADSHSDNVNLRKAITQAKQNYPNLQFIIGLGDYTEVGTLEEFKNAKAEFDLSTLRYFLLAGDHDLWDSRDKQNDPLLNFRQTFGPSYQSFNFKNFRFILLYNSDNYIGMSDEQLKWLSAELGKAQNEQSKGTVVFVHEPLYHPSSDHVMGRVEKDLKLQARSLSYQLKNAGVKKVFAGDTHIFGEYEEPETKLAMVTIGAVTVDRNPQTPRFAVGYVFEDGTVRVEDVEIK